MSHDGIPEGDSRVGTAEVRRSARVSTVARLLDCDESQVRRLVRAGTLEAHRIGKRGLRIFLDSVATYQEARAEPSAQSLVMTRQRRAAARSSHIAAIAKLRARGLLE
jgi:excisionase family DNA binding protein